MMIDKFVNVFDPRTHPVTLNRLITQFYDGGGRKRAKRGFPVLIFPLYRGDKQIDIIIILYTVLTVYGARCFYQLCP